jgi:hypothetical protein
MSNTGGVNYVGGPPSQAPRQGGGGCRLFRGSGHVCEFGKTASCQWVFVVVASDWSRSRPTGSKIVLKFGSQVGGVVEIEVWTADKQPVALLAKI